MRYLLVAGALLAAALVGLFGVLVYASPNPNDRLEGRLIGLAAVGIVALTFFSRSAVAAAVLATVVVAVFGALAWWLLVVNRG